MLNKILLAIILILLILVLSSGTEACAQSVEAKVSTWQIEKGNRPTQNEERLTCLTDAELKSLVVSAIATDRQEQAKLKAKRKQNFSTFLKLVLLTDSVIRIITNVRRF